MTTDDLHIRGDRLDAWRAAGSTVHLGRGPDGHLVVDSDLAVTTIAIIDASSGVWTLDAVAPGQVSVDDRIVSRLVMIGDVTVRVHDGDSSEEIRFRHRAPSTNAAEHTVTRSTLAGSRTNTDDDPAPGSIPPRLVAHEPPEAEHAAASTDLAPQWRSDVAAASGAPASLTVRDLTVVTDGRTRLDAVDLDMKPGTFLAVLGTSGAGKSTLLKALTGVDPANAGVVLFDGVDLYSEFEAVRSRIGYVPQDDILHPQLTVRETLEFASRLRFPADIPDQTRLARIDGVLDELGIAHRAEAAVDELSGGQRKRVNVAVELLTEPDLLILDEPTSGLDPGNERLIMELLRELADGGRMVIVVTHSIESLHLCDDVLFLAPGGVPVYYGAPAGLAPGLGASGYTDVFGAVERLVDPSSIRVQRITRGPLARRSTTARGSVGLVQRMQRAEPEELGRQFRILTERYLQVMRADRRNLIILAAQAPVIATLMVLVFGSGHLASPGRPEAGNVLMAMSLATIYLGASNAVREIVKERSILRREQNFGLSIVAYLGSKFAVLGVLTVAQAGLLVVAGVLRQSGPEDALVLGQPVIELMVLTAVCGLSALALGLLISAWASSGDKAMTLLPVMLFAQFLMAGLIFPVGTIGIQQLSWFMSARWGFSGSAATADFWTARGCGHRGVGGSTPDCSSLWQHDAFNLVLSYTMLLVLTAAALFLAWKVIVRNDPVQVLARADGGQDPASSAPPF